MRSWLCVNLSPSSFSDLRSCSGALASQKRQLFWFGFVAMSWVLWTTRNKFTIENIFPSKPIGCLFKLVSFLQQWKLLTMDQDRGATEDLIARVHSTTSSMLQNDHANVG